MAQIKFKGNVIFDTNTVKVENVSEKGDKLVKTTKNKSKKTTKKGVE